MKKPPRRGAARLNVHCKPKKWKAKADKKEDKPSDGIAEAGCSTGKSTSAAIPYTGDQHAGTNRAHNHHQ